MTGLAKPNQIAIGQLIYEALDEKQKLAFQILNVGTDVWSYVSDRTGSIYSVYTDLHIFLYYNVLVIVCHLQLN